MFQFPRFAPRPYAFRAGCPDESGRVSPFGHRRVTGRLPPRRRFSQAAAPFVASHRLGIHRMRLFTWPCNPNRPGRGAHAPSQLRFACFARARPPRRPGIAGPPGRRTRVHFPNCQRSMAAARAARPRFRATRKRTPAGRACGSPQTHSQHRKPSNGRQ